jgi:glucosamine--fructose-6-phosphate aminotransferase (isomerizing)
MVAKVIESVQRQAGDVVSGAKARRIYLAGCGDSYFSALSARYTLEQLTGLPTVAIESMEFACYTLLPPDSLAIVISSGGEVSMTLEAGRVARQAGVDVIGVTTQKDSPLAREFPCLITTPDLSTSDPVDQVALVLGNFSFSLTALYLVGIHIGQRRGHLSSKAVDRAETELRATTDAIERTISHNLEIHEYLKSVSDEANFYFLGAGPSYGVACFYQAKFFEQAQRPVYGIELEEFIHEQFFLLRPGGEAEVWLIVPPGHSLERALEIMAGCQEMGAHVIAVTNSHNDHLQQKANLAFPVATKSETFSPLVLVVPGELLAIHAFARWGSKTLSASDRGRQMAISKQLTREGKGKL